MMTTNSEMVRCDQFIETKGLVSALAIDHLDGGVNNHIAFVATHGSSTLAQYDARTENPRLVPITTTAGNAPQITALAVIPIGRGASLCIGWTDPKLGVPCVTTVPVPLPSHMPTSAALFTLQGSKTAQLKLENERPPLSFLSASSTSDGFHSTSGVITLQPVDNLMFAADNNTVAVAAPPYLFLLDVHTLEVKVCIQTGNTNKATCVVPYYAHEAYLVVCDEEFVWLHWQTLEVVHRARCRNSRIYHVVSVATLGSMVFLADRGGTRLTRMHGPMALALSTFTVPSSSSSHVTRLVASPENPGVLFGATDAGTVYVWDQKTLAVLAHVHQHYGSVVARSALVVSREVLVTLADSVGIATRGGEDARHHQSAGAAAMNSIVKRFTWRAWLEHVSYKDEL
eukprot:PhM_4_TR18436/c3_g4_i2/m.28789